MIGTRHQDRHTSALRGNDQALLLRVALNKKKGKQDAACRVCRAAFVNPAPGFDPRNSFLNEMGVEAIGAAMTAITVAFLDAASRAQPGNQAFQRQFGVDLAGLDAPVQVQQAAVNRFQVG